MSQQAKVDVNSQDLCRYEWAVADEIRGLVRFDDPAESDRAISGKVKQLEEQTRNPNALPSDWVSRLVSLSMLWKASPYATLNVDSAPPGLEVRAVGLWQREIKVTPLETRIPPGTYTFELIKDGLVVYSTRMTLNDHQSQSIRYPNTGDPK